MPNGYSAGLIDGEGYVGIQFAGGSYQVRLKVAMTDKGLSALRMMQRLHGGRIDGPREPKDNRTRESYTWRLSGAPAVRLLEELRPQLLVKGPAADVAIEFQAMVDAAERLPNGRARWTEQMHERAAMLTRRVQEANRRGPDPIPPPSVSGEPLAVYRWGWWWEPQETLFGPVEFTGRIPTSGRMVAGQLFELPTPAPLMDGSASSSSPGLLPTPTVGNVEGGNATRSGARSDELLLPGVARAAAMGLLPTPTTEPTTGNGHARNLGAEVTLLPTPAVNDMGASYTPETWDEWTAKMQAAHGNGNGHGKSLAIEAQRLLPTPNASDWKRDDDPADARRNSPGLTTVSVHFPSHGATPVSEPERLLPTPTAQAAKHAADDRGPGTLDDANLWSVAARIESCGATTRPPSDAGSTSSDD